MRDLNPVRALRNLRSVFAEIDGRQRRLLALLIASIFGVLGVLTSFVGFVIARAAGWPFADDLLLSAYIFMFATFVFLPFLQSARHDADRRNRNR